MVDLNQLATLLREMDQTQQQTDEDGGAEIAWYYYREQIEDVMELPRDALTGLPIEESR